MAIPLGTLRAASTRRAVPLAKSLDEARRFNLRTVFLCHSHLDDELVHGFLTLISDQGWRVYVDWLDAEMPAVPDETTAKRLQGKISEADLFMFLATLNSTASRWCPWEIGYADSKKGPDKLLIIPTASGSATYGSEYLQLYRRVDLSSVNKLGVWAPGSSSGVFLENV